MRLGDLDALKKQILPLISYEERIYIEPIIDNAPTVDNYTFKQVKELFDLNVQMANEIEKLKRPQGEWINHKNSYGHNIADCSICGKAMQWHDEDEDGVPRYCWYCGAKIRGVKE